MPNIINIIREESKKASVRETLLTIPSVIRAKNMTSSKGLLTGFLNLTMDNAPIIPKDSAISFLITEVIIKAMFGKSK